MANVIRHCACCGREFTTRSADVARGWGLYCGKRCKAIKQEARVAAPTSRAIDDDGFDDDDQSWGAHELWG